MPRSRRLDLGDVVQRVVLRGSDHQPGNLQQKVYVERYNRTVRYDWLAQHAFDTIEEVQESVTRWLWIYNKERPNAAIGAITPMQRLALAAQLHF